DCFRRCNPCPVVKPTFLCGTDNRTYSSLCRLDYHNCIHRTSVKVLCKGFCPCKDGDAHLRKKQKQAERMANFMNKYKATIMEERKTKDNIADKYTFTPQDFSYDNKHYKYIKYTKHDSKAIKVVTNPPYYEDKERMRGDNEVIERKGIGIASGVKTECAPTALQAIGDRLLDWFSVIMADAKRRQTHNRQKGIRFPGGCKTEVRWMFHHLDTDSDAKLSLQELYDLEHDQNERCIKPFLDGCDTDRDIFVTPHEWCKCFDKTDRPCAAVKRRISSNMLGVYIPECDSDGYYYHTQCHNAVGMCWCVDKHGVETPNSRTRGKPNCEAIVGKNKGKLTEDVSDDDDDDDDDDSDQDVEGSADQPLDF
ncbi:hypothetical protein AAG570_006971, partial [Ranatra chinensis]